MTESPFSLRLRTLMESKGLSGYALASKAGLAQSTLSALLSGTKQPTWQTVQKLAEALGCTPNDFLSA